MTRTYAFTVDGGRVRLDRFLGEALREQDVSREKVKRAIRDGGCLVDGAVCTDVSTKVVKIIQSYTGVVNKMVWRKN